ncbi:aryl hydrocarbon receptor-like [Pempheris klunzingeri]|uniref:aryl hydrocarbon receptor-like n=1 Tax=Pempheris klunzingeri TaxID=3127111 RepID=UPI00397F4625
MEESSERNKHQVNVKFVRVKPSGTMLAHSGPYANKKRKKPVLKQKKLSEGNEAVKSNPSKRHRDRLNGELDRLTDLLPFPDEVCSRLDKLSVLRLSVGYLRVKSYFKASMNSSSSLMFPGVKGGQSGNNVDLAGFSEGDLLLQALNGFVVVITSEGTVFYSSATIKDYLGFHQSDVVHQSVFEFIHTDDRDLFRQQLHFALDPPTVGVEGDVLQSCAGAVMYSPEQLPPENSSFLERSFVCRFRCLLDNSSGFLALKFQGRLKYLHGQRDSRDNGTCNKPQLALFTIAVPVQPPSIVEIRAKMLLFQSKHKLDFTPMGIDSRGKIILGYSEVELCMKGSGYQFIHAADMMYCADNHVRMMKTGESGLTVFRLLSKSGGWVWVKSNAKLIYKGGRPEFIIAYQRALVNAEGEEHLRQRRLQLPFSFTTGEAVLYNSGATVDVTQFQFNKMFGNNDTHKDVAPGSLLDSFLKQDETVYTQTVDPPLPVDQVFMDSRALVSFPGDAGQEGGAAATPAGAVIVKEETKQSLVAVIDSLGKIAEKGDFCTVLQDLDVSEAELMQWENAVKSLSQSEDQQNSVGSELDSILTNDIFDYIDTILFKEKGDDCENSSPGSCLAAFGGNQQDPFGQAAGLSGRGLCEPQLFQTPSPHCAHPPMNGVFAHQQEAIGGPLTAGQGFAESAQILSSTDRLTHHGPPTPQTDTHLPPLQQLELQDIFSPSIELPELTVPNSSAPFQSFCQAPIGHLGPPQPPISHLGPPQPPIGHLGPPQGICEQMQSSQLLLCPPAPAVAANGRFLQSSGDQLNNVAPSLMDILPPLVPCNDFTASSTPNVPLPFATSCLQGSPPSQTHSPQVQRWPQQKLHHVDVTQNGHEPTAACHSQASEGQTFPHTGLWCRSVTGLNHAQQGGLACGQAAAHSSCMFNQHFSSSPAGGDVLALSGPEGPRGTDTFLDQSPPQGSCYFQWSQSEPVVGASAIGQEKSGVSARPNEASTEHRLDYLRHT